MEIYIIRHHQLFNIIAGRDYLARYIRLQYY
jgi:hypothetical protein